MRNELHISSASAQRVSAAGFIGTAAWLARIAMIAMAIGLSACDETKSTRPESAGIAPTGSEPGSGRGDTDGPPPEVRWSPGGGTQEAAGTPPPDGFEPILADAPEREGWAIVLATFTAQDHRQQASDWLTQFRKVTPFTGAWIESDERGSVVRYGSYPTVDAKAAQQDLSKLKSFVYNGGQPFARAYLSRYGLTSTAGRLREYHLSQALKFFPGEDTVYSLQIGVYEAEQETTREQARRLAEEAVMQLRAQGEMAFYYHGPNRSMVCVGAFPSAAVDAATGFYSGDVRALQQRFPYNSFNGRSLKQNIVTMTGQRREELQPSFLVQVPKE